MEKAEEVEAKMSGLASIAHTRVQLEIDMGVLDDC